MTWLSTNWSTGIPFQTSEFSSVIESILILGPTQPRIIIVRAVLGSLALKYWLLVLFFNTHNHDTLLL